ncbi:acyl-CoA N-acyltransferase [Pholiota molesta]|nr:acyl-CoA N-acyltransferase [Pholiota molesta]
MGSVPLLDKRAQVHVRLFQESDTKRIHELYMQSMVYGPNSPPNIALKQQPRNPFTVNLYCAFGLGLALLSYMPSNRIAAALLLIMGLAVFFSTRLMIWRDFKLFSEDNVNTDLSDIKDHYGTKPSAFWVAEITDGSMAGKGKVVGCVGLEAALDGTANLKRMAVDPAYQKHGVGRALMTTLLDHAKASDISTISLSTTVCHVAAMKMYERVGFTKGEWFWHKIGFPFTVLKLHVQNYHLDLRSMKKD